jgi:hypothetical protein
LLSQVDAQPTRQAPRQGRDDDLVEPPEVERIRHGGERIRIAHVPGDLTAGGLTERGERPSETISCRHASGHFGIDNPVQTLGRGRHHEVEHDLPVRFESPTPDGVYERDVAGGSVRDE